MEKHYNLSYQVGTVGFNGKKIVREPEEKTIKTLEILKSLDIDEVMLSGYLDVEKAEFDMMEESIRFGKVIESMGMKAAQHHGLAIMYAPIGESQGEAVDALKRSVDYSVNLKADVLMIHPGWCTKWRETSNRICFETEVAKHGLDTLLEVCAKNLSEAADYAAERGIKIALENLDRFEPMANIEILPRLIRMIDSPALGFCLDSGHAHCCCDNVLQWLDELGDKMITSHFHDNRGMRGDALTDKKWIEPATPVKIDEHLPPGFGTIPWVDVIRKLNEIKYDYTINFESGGWPGLEEKEGFAAAINYWRTCEFLADKSQD